MELEKPLVFGASVASACLSESTIDPSQSCMAAGWGVNKPGGNDESTNSPPDLVINSSCFLSMPYSRTNQIRTATVFELSHCADYIN